MSRDSAACLLFLSCFFVCQTTQAQNSSPSPEGPGGTAPRASAAKYHSHAQKDGFSLGAELPSKKEASSVFAANVNRRCLLVPVAVYPKKDESIELSPFDLSLVEVNADKPVRPESPATVSQRLEKKKNPQGDVNVATSGGVGYESGTYIDPVTGQPVHFHGVSTSAGVGISTGNSPLPTSLITTAKGLNANFMKRGCRKQEFPFPWLVTCTFHFAR